MSAVRVPQLVQEIRMKPQLVLAAATVLVVHVLRLLLVQMRHVSIQDY